MTTFLLIRHATCDPVGRLIAGRQPGVHLNDEGRIQAAGLARRLAGLPLMALYSSPLERARETAEPIASRSGLQVQLAQGFNEIDFGDWTGRTITELNGLPAWNRFNSSRGSARIPGGESMPEVLSRALAEMEGLVRLHPKGLVGVVSHGDVLRALLLHAVGASLDQIHTIEVSPASISALAAESHGRRVLLLNSSEGWPF